MRLFKVLVTFGTLVFFTDQAYAGVSSIYKWEDDLGNVHYTEDSLKIPSRYQAGPRLNKTQDLPLPKTGLRMFSKHESSISKENISEDQKRQSKQAIDPETEKFEKALKTDESSGY